MVVHTLRLRYVTKHTGTLGERHRKGLEPLTSTELPRPHMKLLIFLRCNDCAQRPKTRAILHLVVDCKR